jgi:poly-beta-1,6-N-acetyl-D-glucosamine synthase
MYFSPRYGGLVIGLIVFLIIFFTIPFFLQFLGYPLIIGWKVKPQHRLKKDYSFQPFISVVVPTYNEGKVIKARIDNLLSQHYPLDKFEIIIVDSGSKDNTANIGKEYEKRFSNIRVIEEGKRNGKASAINLGSRHARGEIVIVTDANSIFDDNALKEIAPHFSHTEIGGVGGRFVLTNPDNNLVQASAFYWDIESLMRRGESNFDSACLFHGEINAWRKDIVKADVNAVTEDLEMAVQIRKKGYKIVYEPEALAYEAGPSSNKEQIIQKKRTTIGTIQCFFKHRKYLWLPHDKYSGIIFPLHKLLQIISPFLLLGVLGSFITLLAMQAYFFSFGYAAVTIASFSISYLILTRRLSEIRIARKRKKPSRSLKILFHIIYYVLLHEFIILLAWKDFLTNQYSVAWQKAESTRI